MPVPFFDLKRQLSSIKPEVIKAIENCLDSGSFILGPTVSLFEELFAKFIGVKYAVSLASGTDALHLALRSLNIKEGDEIITTPFTFVATAEAIAYCGAKPVFVDIEPNSFNIDPSKIVDAVTKKTKAVIPVHLFGQPVDANLIINTCKKYNLYIVEDCAQSIGSEYHQHKSGSLGNVGCFSFFPTKNFGCFGDGGMITTNDDAISGQILILRNHGSAKTYHYDIIGYNSRLDAIQASILLARFKFLDDWTAKRRYNAKLYYNFLSSLSEIALPSEDSNSKHVYNQFTIRAKDRDKLFEYLKTNGIGCMVYYPLSLHLQKAFSYLGYKKGSFPEAEKAQDEVLSLPIFPELLESEIEEVCSFIKRFYGQS